MTDREPITLQQVFNRAWQAFIVEGKPPATKKLSRAIIAAATARDFVSNNAQLDTVTERVNRVLVREELITDVYAGSPLYAGVDNGFAYSCYLCDCQLLAAAYLQQRHSKKHEPEPAPIPSQTITLDSLRARNFNVVLEGSKVHQGDLAVLVNPRYSGYFRLVVVGPTNSDGQFVKSQLHWCRPWLRQPTVIFTSVDSLDIALSRNYAVISSREVIPRFDNLTEPLGFGVLNRFGFYQFVRDVEQHHCLFVHSATLGWFELTKVRSINGVQQLSLTWINTSDAHGPILAQVWTTAQLADLVRSFYRVKLESERKSYAADTDRQLADRAAKLLEE